MSAAKDSSPRATGADLAGDPTLQAVQALTAQVDYLVRRQRAMEDLMAELMPIGREAMGVGAERLQALDEQGWFTFGRELMGVLERVVTSYSAEDVRQLGDNVVSILDTVRQMTQPAVMEAAASAGEAIQEADGAEGTGLFGMLKASHDDDVRKGMAVMLNVLRQVGKSASRRARSGKGAGGGGRNRALERMLAPRHTRTESSRAEAAPRRAAAPRPAPSAPAAAAPAPSRPRKDANPPPDLGLAMDADGFLVDPGTWTREFAIAMASWSGIEALTSDHWVLIEYARKQFIETGTSVNVRKLATGSGLGTRAIYTLFPGAPGKTLARIAGIPKPVGCI